MARNMMRLIFPLLLFGTIAVVLIFLTGTQKPTPDNLTIQPSIMINPEVGGSSTSTPGIREGFVEYISKENDTIFSIAEQFDISPATIVETNKRVFSAETRTQIIPGMKLRIPTEDGFFHIWKEGDRLAEVAQQYGVTPEDIAAWPENQQIGVTVDDEITFKEGQQVFIPRGKINAASPLSWFRLGISRDNPEMGREFGPGYCTQSVSGNFGTGTYDWPIVPGDLSGIENGKDHLTIPGVTGQAVRAADDGVVVFSGMSLPYWGKVVILDHGEGILTYYGNLSQIEVSCGQSIVKGQEIAFLGDFTNANGPFLRFELFIDSIQNPIDYLQIIL